jgi:YHS domain-containing protein
MKTKQVLLVLLFAICGATTNASMAQTTSVAPARPSLVGSWLVTVEGDAATRTLIVTEEAPTSDGALLQAQYGMTTQGQSPISARMLRVSDQRQLVLVTQAGTRIAATETSDGTFKGTFTLKNGGVKEVAIARISEEMRRQLAQAGPTLALQKSEPNAPSSHIRTTRDGVAIDGHDAVAYFTKKAAIKGSAEYTFEWEGAKWLFTSADHRDLFIANPQKYAPQYGGYCAYGIATGYISRKVGYIDTWNIYEDKLYMFPDRDAQSAWFSKGGFSNVRWADQNWPKLRETLESRPSRRTKGAS